MNIWNCAARLGGSTIAIAAVGILAAEPAPADRNLLWNIVNFKCLRHLTKSEAPIPCDSVNVSTGWDRGVAYLKDFEGVARMLAIPTHRVTGIEDPVLLTAEERNYFASAWAGRGDVEGRLGKELPREAMAITVDSMASRSQDQLYLQIDCVDKDVAASLASYSGALDTQWRAMTIDLKGGAIGHARSSRTIFPTPRLSFCSPTGSTARKPTWGFGRSLRSAPISPANPDSFCSPTAQIRRPEATRKICKIATAPSRDQNRKSRGWRF